MVCKEVLPLMHKYFDGDLAADESHDLKAHLGTCEACRRYFRQMERTEAIVRAIPPIPAPDRLTERIMESLPPIKRRRPWLRFVKRHPAISVAVVFALVMFGSFATLWNEDKQLTIKGTDLDKIVIQGDTVYVPAGQTIHGDLMVKSGKVQVEGEIEGNVVVIDGSFNMASTAHISGQVMRVNQAFEWIWFKLNEWIGSLSK